MKNLIFIFLFISSIFFSCDNPDFATLDTSEKGIVQGKVLVPEVENNQIIWIGAEDLTVEIQGITGFYAKTKIDGSFYFQDVPEGLYEIKASDSHYNYSSDKKTVIVIKDEISIVEDFKLEPCGYGLIIVFGKCFYQDKATPYSNKTLKIYRCNTDGDPSLLEGTTITSDHGDFAFEITGYNWFVLNNNENEFNWFPHYSVLNLTSTSGIINNDAFVVTK